MREERIVREGDPPREVLEVQGMSEQEIEEFREFWRREVFEPQAFAFAWYDQRGGWPPRRRSESSSNRWVVWGTLLVVILVVLMVVLL